MVVVDRRGIHVTYWAEMRQALRALGAGRERCTWMVSLPRDSLLKSKTKDRPNERSSFAKGKKQPPKASNLHFLLHAHRTPKMIDDTIIIITYHTQ